ncbi:hypothetical protein K432DRAFT_341784 [Lepidopterella palustris CBS 459.81]|uniref:ELYS-like domain-containing protein n=1 Tax=Lepidopterella palustris CBS 459.81 TaxID=1314670 RepID=A0A8E2EMF2_9PEZI|nr:hypothetical protein K432DRAFT_341784 [Lepidopterella palustris CBS 459.81]
MLTPPAMIDITEFNQVFTIPPDHGYGERLYNEISRNRRILEKLFFDRLVEVLKVNTANLYPPRTMQDLRDLHYRIVDSEIALHNKHCLLFYLLKDLSPSTHTETELAAAFAHAVHLPAKLWTFLEGLWALDRLQFQTATDYLTHPSLIPTFPDDILDTLLKHAKEEDARLALAYYHTVSPPLKSVEVRDRFFKYLADINVTEAFYWARARSGEEHRHLLELLIQQTLHSFAGEKRAARGVELVDLPLSEEEEEWFEAYLIEGRGRLLHGARDTVMMRRIATGRLKEAVRDGGVKGRKYDDVSWEVVKDGIGRGLGPRKDEDSFMEV